MVHAWTRPVVGVAGDQCVPAPAWDNLATIATEDVSLDDMCQIVLVNTTYRDQLLADQFGRNSE